MSKDQNIKTIVVYLVYSNNFVISKSSLQENSLKEADFSVCSENLNTILNEIAVRWNIICDLNNLKELEQNEDSENKRTVYILNIEYIEGFKDVIQSKSQYKFVPLSRINSFLKNYEISGFLKNDLERIGEFF